MLNSYCRLTVPKDLTAFYRVTDTIRRANINEFNKDIVINRDTKGNIASVNYFSSDNQLQKQICYKDEDISKINYYNAGCLTTTEAYKDGLLALKFIFNNKGYLQYSYEYQYNRKKQITQLCRKNHDEEIKVEYKYDDFDRIIKRIVSLNHEYLLEQTYRYDILDRIVEYRDDNQRIVVNRISKNNELLYYIITDKMNNDVRIFNHFTDANTYDYTEILVNGHSSTVKDESYVDNIMLKKPHTNEDDLDLIIANLFSGENLKTTKRTSKVMTLSPEKLIDDNIEQRVLPISLRKRLLYSMAIKV